MGRLSKGMGSPIVTHIMPTDTCQHSCAFCSVLTREGNILRLSQIEEYLDQLIPLGLKAVIISGGGNPILYRCPETGAKFDDLVTMIHFKGLEIGLITNGMPMKDYPFISGEGPTGITTRRSWKSVSPSTLDKLTWVRISMSGLDHPEKTVFVPDIDRSKTTLGFSYVLHDIYPEPEEPNHGKVSTPEEWVSRDNPPVMAEDILPWLQEELKKYVDEHKPVYLRMLPNCLQPKLIESRCATLRQVADFINPDIAFVQYKPPQAPRKCLLNAVHPVLNSDGYVFNCDSVVLAAATLDRTNHKFDTPWRWCKWDEIGEAYSKPLEQRFDPQKICKGCVFSESNNLLAEVAEGGDYPAPSETPRHPNFL